MKKIQLSRIADVVDVSLVREILYRCGYGATRVTDSLTVYSEQTSRSLYVNPDSVTNYSKTKQVSDLICSDNIRVSTLYCDEGLQSSCLRADGTVGVNKPWIEMCDMNEVLELIIGKLDPDRKYKPSPYMGSGSTARFYHEQYCQALDELLPGSELEQYFDWHVLPQESEVA